MGRLALAFCGLKNRALLFAENPDQDINAVCIGQDGFHRQVFVVSIKHDGWGVFNMLPQFENDVLLGWRVTGHVILNLPFEEPKRNQRAGRALDPLLPHLLRCTSTQRRQTLGLNSR